MPQFTLEQAHALMPKVKELTDTAVNKAQALVAEAQELDEEHPRREALQQQLQEVVNEWVQAVTDLGAEVKGLWLVDFDSGEGYYCWRHPEPSLEYFHGYEEGFAGRRPIAPPTLH